jgi:outer membrane protein OmpA-like peptidoglycan-associated protein/ABC-type amino acid transport substrate-binding protein
MEAQAPNPNAAWRIPMVIACLLAIVAMIAWKATEGKRVHSEKTAEVLATSDARNFSRTVEIWGDDWLGYMIFSSKVFQDTLAANNLGAKYTLVPDFKRRVEGLAQGKCDFACITIDSWILNGKASDYPGAIVFVIDESNGGDAIVGGPKIHNLDDLKNTGFKGGFVGSSPSEFLLKAGAAHFQMTNVTQNLHRWRRDSIDDVYQSLKKQEIDFAVLWEPLVSKAQQEIPNCRVLLDTTQATDIIIDVAVANRKILRNERPLVNQVSQAYFKALHYYLNRPQEMLRLAASYGKTREGDARKMLGGIIFSSLQSNQQTWFGTSSTSAPMIVDAINRITDVLVASGDMSADPLGHNPYTVLNSQYVATLKNGIEDLSVQTVRTAKIFKPLSADEWHKLASSPVGTLIDEPVTFQSGTSLLSEEAQELLDKAARRTIHYPRYRIVVEAGVSPGQSPADDEALSQQRADAVRAWLISNGRIDENRVWAVGLGSSQAPKREPEESSPAWTRRCRFAKLVLVSE